MDVATELYEIARCNGDLVTRAQARAVGVSDQRLHELARHGVLARVARGVYSAGHSPRPYADPQVVTTAYNVVLSDESAAAWYGVDLPEPPDHTHVTAPRNRGRRRDAITGVRLHRKTLGGDEVTELRGVRVTTPLRTALDIARHAPLDHGVAIVDSFLRARLLTADEFVAAASRCQGPGRVRIQLVASLIDPMSGSILESLTRVLLWRNQVPAPTSQYSFTHPTRGWIGYMDFAWPQVRAILECDGYEFHASRIPFQKDRRRWSAIGGADWHLGVVTWFDVTCDPQYVVDLVRELLALDVLHTTVA